jgi:hypothetical protein
MMHPVAAAAASSKLMVARLRITFHSVAASLMGKYKAVRKKSDAPPQIKPGLPCLVILIGGMIVIVIVMILVVRNA